MSDNQSLELIKLVFLIPILIAVTGCNDTLFNSGDIQSKRIEVPDFKNIELNNIFDVYLYQDTMQQVIARGGSNLIPNLSFEVDQESTLKINNSNHANWSRNYEKIALHITVDTLHYLTLNAPSNIRCMDTLRTPELKIFSIADYADIQVAVNCENLYVVNSGTSGGQVTLQGRTYHFGFWARASFQLFAEELQARRVVAKNESIGHCFVYSSEFLSAEILKSGLIYYKGDPQIIEYVNEEAKAKLIRID